jgi:mRNA interferase MazF
VGQGHAADDREALGRTRVVGIGHGPAVISPTRGDIHLVAFPDSEGHVLGGPHPAVIVQTDRMRRSSTTLVVPMTSALPSAAVRPPYLVRVLGRQAGLPRDGFAKCDQVTVISTSQVGPRMGRMNPEAMDQVDAALRFVLGL